MSLRLQQRDIDLLSDLARYGVLDSQRLAARHFSGGDRVARRRFAKLTHAGFVNRFSVGEYFYSNGRQPYVYALTERGAEVVIEEKAIDRPRVISDVSPRYVAHTLQVASFLLRLDESAVEASIDMPSWWLEYDLTESFRIDPDPKTPFAERYVLHETFDPPQEKPKAKRFSYRSDAAFSLTYRGHVLLGYLEVDRSTEPLRVFGKKLPAFSRMVSEERFRNHWSELNGQPVTVRCYVTVRSRKRLRSIASYLQSRGQGQAVRLASRSDLDRNILTDAVWSTVDTPDEKGPVIRG